MAYSLINPLFLIEGNSATIIAESIKEIPLTRLG
jgi:hypothetical protein